MGPFQRAVDGLVREVAKRRGLDLVPRHFYSPLPDLERLPGNLWDGPAPLIGVDLELDKAFEFLDGPLRPFAGECDFPLDPPSGGGFYVHNRGYETVDAETLYAMVRYAKPARVIELGSGGSSHVIDLARQRNTQDGHDFIHTIFDPYPWQANPMGPVAGAAVRRVPAQEVPVEEIANLGRNDVLFVDTTHTVKTGGDVNRIVLDLLPRLAPGVLVHFHDIFLPYEYLRDWVVEQRKAWAEQYLLQAFLAFNRDFEVVLPVHALTQARPDLVRDIVRSYSGGPAGGAFWVRRSR